MDPSGADIAVCHLYDPHVGTNVYVMEEGVGGLGEHLGQEMEPHDAIRNLIHQDMEGSIPPGPM